MNKVAFCTIASANYFAYAKTMLKSLEVIHPESDRYFLLVDNHHERIASEPGFTTVYPGDLGIENFARMSFVFDIVELNTSVKPFLLAYLLKKGYKKVIYLDPDIFVYRKLDRVLDALDTHSIVLTPHSVHPAPPATSFMSRIEHEKNMSTTGIFNLGFIGISKKPETVEFLSWWQNRCTYLCYVDPTAGMFVDQKWGELAIAYWQNVYILRDPGYNMSIWNLHGRTLSKSRVNKKSPLVFYHFSSIDIHDASILAKNERDVRPDDHPELKELFSNYRKAVIENGYEEFRKVPYAFNYFSDGRKIDIMERRLYGMVAGQFGNPFTCTRKEFYKELRKLSGTITHEDNGFMFSAFGTIAYWLFRIIGPGRYRKLALFLGKSAQLRAHTFLLR